MYDLNGKYFGRLFIIQRDTDIPSGASKEIWWKCLCECGVITSVRSYSLRKGVTRSCGCYGKEQLVHDAGYKHGYHQTPTYHSWEKMKSRCNNPNNPSYSRYGGIGVSYDKRWETFEPFLEDMGDRPEGMSLDRINPFGNYGPSNCRWATWKEQANNQRRNTKFRGGDAHVVAV